MNLSEFIEMCQTRKWFDLIPFLNSSVLDMSYKITVSAVIGQYHPDKKVALEYGLTSLNQYLSDRIVSQYAAAMSTSFDLIDFANAYHICIDKLKDEQLAKSIKEYVKNNQMSLALCLDSENISKTDKDQIASKFGDLHINKTKLEEHYKKKFSMQAQEKISYIQSIDQLSTQFETLFGLKHNQFNLYFPSPSLSYNGVKNISLEGSMSFAKYFPNEVLKIATEFLNNLGIKSNFYDMNWQRRKYESNHDKRGIQLWDKPQEILEKIFAFEKQQDDKKDIAMDSKSSVSSEKQRLFAAKKNLEEFKNLTKTISSPIKTAPNLSLKK